MELHHIALPGDPQGGGGHRKSTEDQDIPPALPGLVVVGPAVEDVPLHRPEVFLPLLLNVNEGPLAAAEGKVLQTGQLEKVLLTIAAHTPSITSASSPSRGTRRMS